MARYVDRKVTVQWENEEGSFARELFVAYKGDIVVQRFTAPEGHLNVDISLILPDEKSTEIYGYGNLVNSEECTYEFEVTDELINLLNGHIILITDKGICFRLALYKKGREGPNWG